MTSCGEKNVPLLLNLYVSILINSHKRGLSQVSIVPKLLNYQNQNHYAYPTKPFCLTSSAAWFSVKRPFSPHFRVTKTPMPKTSSLNVTLPNTLKIIVPLHDVAHIINHS